jgi:hypothetical protein
MIRSTAFIILGTLAAMPAMAQAPTDLSNAPVARGNVVGGGGATMSGGGDDMTITYSRSGAGGGARFEQLGQPTTFARSAGDDAYMGYEAPSADPPGRNAWLLGGGENAQVVYSDPTAGRRR